MVAGGVDDWALWGKLPRPDLCLYITVSVEMLATRQAKRGSSDDEHPELSRRLDASYRSLLPRYAPNHAVVTNEGDFPDTLLQVERTLSAMP